MDSAIKFNMPSMSPKTMFRLLVLVFWCQHTILKFATEIIERLPFVSSFANYIVPGLFISSLALSLPYILRRIRTTDILFVLSIVLVVVMTLLLYKNSSNYIYPELWRIFGLSVPLFFVGVIYEHEEAQKDLYWGSLIGVCVMFMYQLYVLGTGRVLETDNMSASYNTLPSIMYLIYWAIIHKGIKNWAVALAASALSLIFGTRGPIVAILVFLAIGIIYKVLKLENIVLKIIVIFAIGVSLLYITSGDTIMSLAMSLSETFGEIGFSTRIFDFIIEEQIAESEGRDVVRAVVLEAIKQRLILGYGFMGDRMPLEGYYVHNIVLEYLCSYGIILGVLLLILTILLPMTALIKSWRKSDKWFLVMLVCMVFTKLMLSGSYTNEAYFFMLLGFSVNILRKKQSG